MTEDQLYALLEQRGIAYETYHHEAVRTVAEADLLVPRLVIPTKNLFLRDDKKRQFFLVVAHEDTQEDLKHLHQQLREAGTDMTRIKQILEQLKQTQELRNALAQQLGNDIIV